MTHEPNHRYYLITIPERLNSNRRRPRFPVMKYRADPSTTSPLRTPPLGVQDKHCRQPSNAAASENDPPLRLQRPPPPRLLTKFLSRSRQHRILTATLQNQTTTLLSAVTLRQYVFTNDISPTANLPTNDRHTAGRLSTARLGHAPSFLLSTLPV